MDLKYHVMKKYERAIRWIVWHLPSDIVYWSAIRVGANATTGKHSSQIVPDLTFMEALQRWEKK